MAATVYVLGALVSALCSILLFRRNLRARQPLLMWSGLCFAGLAVSNGVLVLDLVFFPAINLYLLRLAIAAAAASMLLYGLISESVR
jgi:hypothetical protein